MTSIGGSAYKDCTSLTNVTIGSAVRKIGDQAFAGCEKITEIYSLAVVPPTCASAGVFDTYVYLSAMLYVPNERNSIGRYKASDVWSKFFDISEYDFSGIENIIIDDVSGNSKKPVYDLTGRRINNLTNGINIINGKKYLVK